MLEEIIKGLIVGLGASIPLGPVGVLVVQRTISKGRLSGFVSGAGAACADTLFASLAVLSLAFVQNFFSEHKILLLIIGGFIVIALGVNIYLKNPIKQLRRKKQEKRLLEDFVSVFFLTLSNPGAFFLILALFALVRLNVSNADGILNVVIALFGVMVGALLWWFILSSIISRFRRRFRIRQLWVINRVAGIIIAALGIISVVEGIVQWIKVLFS